jgi:two-component system phosphate regulon sensor histidine kinase PhoR
VEDHGPGITDEEKESIFSKFYRSGNEETRQTKGSGLGLYIVSEFVHLHQGKIICKNNSPKGCIFEVTLPL